MSKLMYKGTATFFKKGKVYDVEISDVRPLEGPVKEKVIILNIDGRQFPYMTLEEVFKNWEVAPVEDN